MITHILFLVALLQMEDAAPKAISPHKTHDDCQIAARKMNTDERLESPEAKEMGLRYVCFRIVGEA